MDLRRLQSWGIGGGRSVAAKNDKVCQLAFEQLSVHCERPEAICAYKFITREIYRPDCFIAFSSSEHKKKFRKGDSQ